MNVALRIVEQDNRTGFARTANHASEVNIASLRLETKKQHLYKQQCAVSKHDCKFQQKFSI